MSYAPYIKKLSQGIDGTTHLDEDEAYHLFAAMLDDGVSDLELGAIVIALRMKTEAVEELLGFERAMAERVYALNAPKNGRLPIVLPSYNGARHQPNLLPLLAFLLREFGIPVLLHGTLQSNGRVTTASILRELGHLPCIHLAQAETQLTERGMVFLPTATLCPGIAALLTVRERIGLRNSGHSMVKLMNPFLGGSLRVVNVSHPAYYQKMHDFLLATSARALLLRGTEGEPFANPKRRPQMEFFNAGVSQVLFENETGTLKTLPQLPASIDAITTANWISRVLARDIAVPQPIINQLACCLYGSGYACDMSQAIMLAAGHCGHLVSA